MSTYSNYQLSVRGPAERRIYPLPSASIIIGYDPACDLFLDDRAVADRHARLDYTGDGFTLTQLSVATDASVTLLENEVLIPSIPFPLRIGETFQIGSYILRFETQTLTEDFAEVDESFSGIDQMARRLYPYPGEAPPGLSRYSLTLLSYLPAIYQPERPIVTGGDTFEIDGGPEGDCSPLTFLSRFLALFESVLLPIEWLIENFDFYLAAATAPIDFFPWLESWYGLPLVADLGVEQRRQLLYHAHELYDLKGSPTALVKVIELCTGCTPTVDDLNTPGASFHVTCKAAVGQALDASVVEQLIIAFKPVHTSYKLTIG